MSELQQLSEESHIL